MADVSCFDLFLKFVTFISYLSFIFVSGFCNFIFSYDFKSSGVIAYSQSNVGGAMAVAAARPFLSELGCLPVRQFVTIPFVSKTTFS